MREVFSFSPWILETSSNLLRPAVRWLVLHNAVAFVLATNYFAFQVEPFEEEYEANHPARAETCAFSQPTITWESFDKQNAPKAFVFDADVRLQFLFSFPPQRFTLLLPNSQYQPIRDKSPPNADQA
jgi:hypothetical protein